MLNDNTENKIIELPNIIFYEKNNYNLLFSEVDIIIPVDIDTEVSDFMVYSITEFRNGERCDSKSFNEGKVLKLQ